MRRNCSFSMPATGGALLLAALLTFGCSEKGDGDVVIDPFLTDPDLNRETSTNLVTRYLPHVVSSEDSARTASCLGTEFRFDPEDGGGKAPDEDPYTRAALLDSIGRIFHGREDHEGKRVKTVSLLIDERGTFLDRTEYEGKPAGENWYKSIVFFNLLLIYEGPEGETNRLVQNDVAFVSRPDPDDPDLWVFHLAYIISE